MYGKQGAFLKSDGGWCGRRGSGEDWTAVAIPTSLCWLRANARSSLCIYFSSAFQHCVHLVFEAGAETHLVRQMYAAHEQQRARAEMPWPVNKLFLSNFRDKHEFLMTSKKRKRYPLLKFFFNLLPNYIQIYKCKVSINLDVCFFIQGQYVFSICAIYMFRQQTIRGRWLLPQSLPTGN